MIFPEVPVSGKTDLFYGILLWDFIGGWYRQLSLESEKIVDLGYMDEALWNSSRCQVAFNSLLF